VIPHSNRNENTSIDMHIESKREHNQEIKEPRQSFNLFEALHVEFTKITEKGTFTVRQKL